MADGGEKPLRIGYVPEHFSTPLHFAVNALQRASTRLNATLFPFPSGTGHMITSLKSSEIDIGIGLTEGWIAELGKTQQQQQQQASSSSPSADQSIPLPFKIIGTYVSSPLRWSISTGTGPRTKNIHSVSDLLGKKCGVSRIGSGSYVMSFVLADQRGWLSSSEFSDASVPNHDKPASLSINNHPTATATSSAAPFDIVPLQTFKRLRDAVNAGDDEVPEWSEKADFFMWEHFTSKRYYDNGEIRKIGDIYTPWSSWKIVASSALLPSSSPSSGSFSKISAGPSSSESSSSRLDEKTEIDPRIPHLLTTLNAGIAHFRAHEEDAIRYISTELDYSEEDARTWIETVKFADDVRDVSAETVQMTVDVLRKAGVVGKVRAGMRARASGSGDRSGGGNEDEEGAGGKDDEEVEGMERTIYIRENIIPREDMKGKKENDENIGEAHKGSAVKPQQTMPWTSSYQAESGQATSRPTESVSIRDSFVAKYRTHLHQVIPLIKAKII
ncbi:hypothetical protein MMC25_004377 [Agyrium rufum]|nr:hypothetical protein [Agyrium rufum]